MEGNLCFKIDWLKFTVFTLFYLALEGNGMSLMMCH